MIASLSMILDLIKSFPAILGVLLELRKMWNQYIDQENRKKNMEALQAAIKDARENRDTTKLTNLVNDILNNKPANGG